jgi:hypothetical protein
MAGHGAAGLAPSGQHRRRLALADVLGGGRAVVLDARRHVAGVAVGKRVDDVLGAGHVIGGADGCLDRPFGRSLVVAAVVLEVLMVDGAVVGKRRVDADGDRAGDRFRSLVVPASSAGAGRRADPPVLIDAQDVDGRIDRIGVAAGVLVDAAAVGPLVEAVVGQVGPEAAVLRDAEQRGLTPADCARPQVGVGSADGLGELVGHEAVHDRIGLAVGHARQRRVAVAGQDRVVAREVHIARLRAVGVGGRVNDVLLGEASPGQQRGGVADHPRAQREQILGDQRHLLPALIDDDRPRVQPLLLADRLRTRARPAALEHPGDGGDVSPANADP